MPKYRNSGGPHELACGKVVAHGDTFECDADLQAIFPNKFELIEGTTKPKAAPASTEPTATTYPPAPAPKRSPDKNAEDVTKGFEVASDYDVRVVRDKRGWWILDGDDVLNTSGPLKKGGVGTFIKRYFEE
tara:strand:- start:6930 stop:7322 length:393 start_codon:yes stop_codon:yes gene_type:complete